MENEINCENLNPCQCFSNSCIRKIDVREIIENFPGNLLKSFTLKFNVYSCDSELLNPCENRKIKTNIILQAYIPLTHTIQFFGFTNHLNIKTENQIIIPFSEEQLYVEVFNYGESRIHIPLHMPIGEIIVKSKEFTDFN